MAGTGVDSLTVELIADTNNSNTWLSADAVRIGGGAGDVQRYGSSGRPRWEEAAIHTLSITALLLAFMIPIPVEWLRPISKISMAGRSIQVEKMQYICPGIAMLVGVLEQIHSMMSQTCSGSSLLAESVHIRSKVFESSMTPIGEIECKDCQLCRSE